MSYVATNSISYTSFKVTKLYFYNIISVVCKSAVVVELRVFDVKKQQGGCLTPFPLNDLQDVQENRENLALVTYISS